MSLLQWLSILLWQLNLPASLSPPSTFIWIFFNPPIFLCGFKNFKMNLPVHMNPTRICIHSSTENSSGNIGNRACIVKCAKFASRSMAESTQKLKKNAKIKVDSSAGKRENKNEVAILNTVFTVKNWTQSCYISGLKKISGFSVHAIPD